MIRFAVSKGGTQAPHGQLVEQVKIGLLTGALRSGETLPSIRDVVREAGVTVTIVRRAYKELAGQGIVTAIHGKGVQVSQRFNYERAHGLAEQYDAMVTDALTRAQKEGLLLSCFARLLQVKARELETSVPPLVYADATESLAAERAAVISEAWAIHVAGVSLEQLRALLTNPARGPLKILTNYYRHSEVVAIVGCRGIPIVPIGLTYSLGMVKRIESLPRGAVIVVAFHRDDRPRAQLILDDYRRRFARSSLRFKERLIANLREIGPLTRSGKYALVLVSTRLWDRLPAAFKGLPNVSRTELELTPVELEQARIAAGVVV